eukprot:14477104-Ditylum_brightwellii.AAC.1
MSNQLHIDEVYKSGVSLLYSIVEKRFLKHIKHCFKVPQVPVRSSSNSSVLNSPSRTTSETKEFADQSTY